jgi:sigma-B regulation protein RsbU (phosphoserine phosphatase)
VRNQARNTNFFISAALLLLAMAHVCLSAQTFNLQTDHEPVTSLEGLWRFHPGDDPRWAAPDFDDSAWPRIRSDRPWHLQGYPNLSGYAWYRFTLQIPANAPQKVLLLPPIYTGYQVYADGLLIGSRASTSPSRMPSFAYNPQTYPLPNPPNHAAHALHIAIRVWEYPLLASQDLGGTLTGGAAVGDAEPIAIRYRAILNRYSIINATPYACAILAAVVGLTVLALFFFHRADREYLWFAVFLLLSTLNYALEVNGWDNIPFLPYRFLDELAVALGIVAVIFFFSIILQIHRSAQGHIFAALAALSPLSLLSYYFQWGSIGFSYVLQLSLLLPAYFWILTVLTIRTLRGEPVARLLFPPGLLYYGGTIYLAVASIAHWLQWKDFRPKILLRTPYIVELPDALFVIFVLALLIFLVRRFSLGRRQEERLSTEIAAARTVQSILIPQRLPDTPGFAVQSIYLPASEVSGDFFQVLALAEGGFLLAIGDVSGKGLPAALMVSLLVGSFNQAAEYTSQPAAILVALNRRLSERSSGAFATCVVLRAQPSGLLTFANAGHLSPYIAGKEFPLPSGLPLGILPGTAYDEKTLHLEPGDVVTLLTDGVIEARNRSGELFGFDRAQSISEQTASEIAHSAQAFGQEDDITVLKIKILS